MSTIKFEMLQRKLAYIAVQFGFGLGFVFQILIMMVGKIFLELVMIFRKGLLYINKKDGTFDEVIERMYAGNKSKVQWERMLQISTMMDGLIFLLQKCLPGRLDRYKSKAIFENWDKYQLSIRRKIS
ncbi:MAG: hypothetical protein IPG00_18000 [Saprospiraceae bacterium]|nr:hypothetical protein [Saprospiraceae bacterium]